MAEQNNYDSKVRKLLGAMSPPYTIDQRDFAVDVLREVATAAAEAQREACAEHFYRESSHLVTVSAGGDIVLGTPLITDTESEGA